MFKPVAVVLGVLTIGVFDLYLYQPVRVISASWRRTARVFIRGLYWITSAFFLLCAITILMYGPALWSPAVRNWIITGMFIVYFSKITGGIFVLADDLQRWVRWMGKRFSRSPSPDTVAGKKIPRSEFLSRMAVLTAGIPFGTLAFGIISGAHDYRIHCVKVYLPHLPRAFDGLRIGQISDIHAGSFFNRTAVKGGVELLMREKPDVIFFTGDLVNNQTDEIDEYMNIFNRLRAPLGVYSVTGNHDYGNYRSWPSAEAKRKNFEDLIEAHRLLGYDLLMNEHRYLTVDGERLAVLGVENWGTGRFPKYGNLEKAWYGADAPVKLLLSHDPSHWDAEVRARYPDIDLMFAGHTHGFQFGIEWGSVRWSPSQYVYKQWAGLYQEGDQYLYVNRGFGYIGYPGRVGIAPELTILELKKDKA
jgi:predicted MPP superfamily phosphohydrolase